MRSQSKNWFHYTLFREMQSVCIPKSIMEEIFLSKGNKFQTFQWFRTFVWGWDQIKNNFWDYPNFTFNSHQSSLLIPNLQPKNNFWLHTKSHFTHLESKQFKVSRVRNSNYSTGSTMAKWIFKIDWRIEVCNSDFFQRWF